MVRLRKMALKLGRLSLQAGLANIFCAIAAYANVVDVTPGGGNLAAAYEIAEPGDTLQLAPGNYYGPLHIKKALTVRGAAGAAIIGPGEGSVIIVDAPDVVISSLRITGSGSLHQNNDAGVKLTQIAARAVVEDNHLIGNLVGVDVHGAVDAQVRNNTIEGRTDHRMNDRGNGVYVWNAPGAVVEGNYITKGRDGIFVNTSRNNVFRDNRIENLRFAIHYMYANDSEISGNVSVGNHLGFALMFSSGLTIRRNVSIGDRNYGIMLNYTNSSIIEENFVKDGHEKCLFMYNANKNTLRGNRFEGCAIGIHFTAGSDRNKVYENAFVGNRIQVKYVGTKDHNWSVEGKGNFWSDNAAFDINGDGIADQTYRPNDIIDKILWTQPSAGLLLGSPAVQLVRWAQSSFPSLLPGGIIDTAPLMRAIEIPMSDRAAATQTGAGG
jgi:nitrous oxidase accessory protein